MVKKLRRKTAPAKNVKDDCRLDGIEERINKLSGVKLNPKYFDVDSFSIGDFHEWLDFTENHQNPDEIRYALYYLFQPLFDSLVSGQVLDGVRKTILRALESTIDMSSRFLLSYYAGEPNLTNFKRDLKIVKPQLQMLNGVPYERKLRNVDRNKIYSEEVLRFLVNYLKHAQNGGFVPDYVVGCACGSSEIAIPVAGLLGCDVGFMRMSKKRHDSEVLVVKEQVSTIRKRTKGSKVLCVEDYVCTGRSLANVMEKAESYGAREVIGASIRYSHEGDYLKSNIDMEGFHIFTK